MFVKLNNDWCVPTATKAARALKLAVEGVDMWVAVLCNSEKNTPYILRMFMLVEQWDGMHDNGTHGWTEGVAA